MWWCFQCIVDYMAVSEFFDSKQWHQKVPHISSSWVFQVSIVGHCAINSLEQRSKKPDQVIGTHLLTFIRHPQRSRPMVAPSTPTSRRSCRLLQVKSSSSVSAYVARDLAETVVRAFKNVLKSRLELGIHVPETFGWSISWGGSVEFTTYITLSRYGACNEISRSSLAAHRFISGMVVVCGYRFIIGTLAESKVWWCSLVGWLDMWRSLLKKTLHGPCHVQDPSLTIDDIDASFSLDPTKKSKIFQNYGILWHKGRKEVAIFQHIMSSWPVGTAGNLLLDLRLATSLGKGHALWPFQCWMVDFSSFKAPREGGFFGPVEDGQIGKLKGLGCSWWWFCWYI